ncbi:MAG: metallophosphoesterase [Candidatus Delongbacteria bacterium]|nr:metallophosphoesterase [Candidatus Delongbacteria bacterium]
MRILLLSDLHGSYRHIYRTACRHDPLDLILLAGDLTHFGPKEALADLTAELDLIESHVKIRLVWGNCDPASEFIPLSNWFRDHYIGNRVIEDDQWVLAGIDGGLTSFFRTPNEYSEQDYSTVCDRILQHPAWQSDGKPRIVLSHLPPYGILDKVRLNLHIGSRSLLPLLQQSDLMICGHVHEQTGETTSGICRVINPGPYKNGSYAVLELDPDKSVTTRFFTNDD